jgi:hypothetical protein
MKTFLYHLDLSDILKSENKTIKEILIELHQTSLNILIEKGFTHIYINNTLATIRTTLQDLQTIKNSTLNKFINPNIF